MLSTQLKVKRFSRKEQAVKPTFFATLILALWGVSVGDSLSSSLQPMHIIGDTTLRFEPGYSSEIISHVADSLISANVREGYLFSSVIPEINEGDTIAVRLNVDSGAYVDSLSYQFYCPKPVKPWIFSRALGVDGKSAFSYELISDAETLLDLQNYVHAVSVGLPQVVSLEDTTSVVLPVFIESNRTLFFDGSVVWSSQEGGGLVGYLDLAVQNLFWAGEKIEFDFYGDKEIQRAKLNIGIPYLRNLPLSFSLMGNVEVGKNEYGFLEGKFGVDYDIWRVWQAGLGFHYYEVTQEEGDQRRFVGVDLTLKKRAVPFTSEGFQWKGNLRAGSGVTIDSTGRLPIGDAEVKLEFQWPLPGKFAIGEKAFVGAVATEESHKLHRTEKKRIGGVGSLRGYSENQYAFLGTGILQSELRFYFQKNGTLFLFGDVAGGVEDHFSADDFTFLFGYGAGIRIPTRKLRFTLVWARHYKEPVGPGRLHVGIGN